MKTLWLCSRMPALPMSPQLDLMSVHQIMCEPPLLVMTLQRAASLLQHEELRLTAACCQARTGGFTRPQISPWTA